MDDEGHKNSNSKRRYPSKKRFKSYKRKNNENDEIICPPPDSMEIGNPLTMHQDYINYTIPYYGWKLFFHDEDYKDNSDTIIKIKTVEDFIQLKPELVVQLTLENLENGTVFTIDINNLYNNESFLKNWLDFKKDLHENPFHTLNCFKLAIHQRILNTVRHENLESINIISALSTIRLRVLNYQPVTCLQELKAHFYGKLVSIRGCVIRVGHVKHLAQWIVFMCCKCNTQKIMKLPQGIYKVPKSCTICGISKFRPLLDSPFVKSVRFQIIKIQELTNDDQNNKGSMPRMVDIELMDELVNACMPGDDITLTGVIKGTSSTKNRNKVSFSLCMEAITIVNNKQRLHNKIIHDNEMSVKDYLAIKEVYNTPNVFPLLVNSLCPSIYGHEIIKAGLLLSLFGGNSEHLDLRENIHILVVGDPGLGKSQMLQACARIASKGVYVCGNSSTSSGLTITLAKENKNSNFTLEPGALVLADKGCCCIDEFDKMNKQHAVLLEAMEQQCVSVAKSGVICSLPTRTSILAAANPIGGRFVKSKSVMQNLKLSAPLLSRFDLLFLLLDEPNRHLDDLLCKHVMSTHNNTSIIKDTQSKTLQYTNTPSTEKMSLRDKLISSVTQNVNVIPQSILRKYIAYARQYVKPRLTKEAAAVLQDYYLKLRSKHNKFDNLSVCNRQLEAMIRLTEARAKLELRTEAVEEDALDVIQILQYTFDSNVTNSQPTCRKNTTTGKIREFIARLKKESLSDNDNTFSKKKLHEIALDTRISMDELPNFITKLNDNGVLLKTGNNTYKFISN